jgi:hypothetical protein
MKKKLIVRPLEINDPLCVELWQRRQAQEDERERTRPERWARMFDRRRRGTTLAFQKKRHDKSLDSG